MILVQAPPPHMYNHSNIMTGALPPKPRHRLTIINLSAHHGWPIPSSSRGTRVRY